MVFTGINLKRITLNIISPRSSCLPSEALAKAGSLVPNPNSEILLSSLLNHLDQRIRPDRIIRLHAVQYGRLLDPLPFDPLFSQGRFKHARRPGGPDADAVRPDIEPFGVGQGELVATL